MSNNIASHNSKKHSFFNFGSNRPVEGSDSVVCGMKYMVGEEANALGGGVLDDRHGDRDGDRNDDTYANDEGDRDGDMDGDSEDDKDAVGDDRRDGDGDGDGDRHNDGDQDRDVKRDGDGHEKGDGGGDRNAKSNGVHDILKCERHGTDDKSVTVRSAATLPSAVSSTRVSQHHTVSPPSPSPSCSPLSQSLFLPSALFPSSVPHRSLPSPLSKMLIAGGKQYGVR